jgi:hypothetical protein
LTRSRIPVKLRKKPIGGGDAVSKRKTASENFVLVGLLVVIGLAILLAFDALGRDAETGGQIDERFAELEARVEDLEGRVDQTESPGKLAPAGSATIVALAKDDLAERLGIYPGDILLVEAEPVEWPDACLGVYEGVDACVQVLTPGFKITLMAADRLWLYHADGGSRVVYVGPVARQLTA